MRVVVNQLATLGRKTGVGHYTGQLLRCLHALPGDHHIDRFPTGGVRRACQTFIRARAYLDAGAGPAGNAADFLAGLRSRTFQNLRRAGRAVVARYFRRTCARHRYDLYHEPNFIPLPTDRPTLATLHDLSVLLHPEWHPPDRVAYFEQNFQRCLDTCVHFLTVSEFSRQEVIRLLNVAPARVTRTYNGIRPGLGPRPQVDVVRELSGLGLPADYLLYLGTIEPRKNLLLLMRAYCSLPDALRARWPLVLVGNWGWNSTAVATYLEAEARHRGVIHLGYLREKHLATVYNGARALLYPSRYEGFGLPPVEMLACGGAVLASNVGALVETVGKRAHLIDPDDEDGWRQAMLRVVTDDDWWLHLRQGACTVVQPFSWERCAEETLRVYRRLSGEEKRNGGSPTIYPLPERHRAAG
jgi:alpha-1,3-rhamnosyl/mannosyltransferase